MWSWRRSDTVKPTSKVQGGCHATLVLHADGVLACHETSCSAAVESHRWWLPCSELVSACGCVGDEHPLESTSRAA